MIVVGIDSGLDGALVALRVRADDRGAVELVLAEVAPTVHGKGRRLYRVPEMRAILRRIGTGEPRVGGGEGAIAFACLERGGTRPKEGASQSWTSGYGFGLWEMALASLDIPYETPTPQQWQKEAYRGIVGEGKERSVLACDRSLPGLDLKLGSARRVKPHLGVADAAAIALYAARRAP